MVSPAYGVLAFLAGVVAAGWLLLGIRKLQLGRRIPVLPEHPNLPTDAPLLSIIIPARNEEQSIGTTLQSLLKQDYPDFEVIVVDDGSEDRTAVIARETAAQSPRLIVLEAPPLPRGWTGKNWGCQTGVGRARGSWLLFLDADATLTPGTVRLAVAYALEQRLDILSLKPFITCRGFWAKATTPLFLNLMALLIPIAKVNDPSTRTAYLYGSFILARRAAYGTIGGHGAIRAELVEDRALGALAKRSGLAVRLIEAGHRFRCLWNTDFPTLWHALQRVLYRSAGRNLRGASLFSLLLFFLLIFPFAGLVVGLGVVTIAADAVGWILLGLGALGGAIAIGTQYRECRYLHLNGRYALTAPVGAALFIAAVGAAIWRARKGLGVSWRGRRYDPFAKDPLR